MDLADQIASYADSMYWRYERRSRYTHALRVADDDDAFCGKSMKDKLGTGNQDEYERAARLPRCELCLAKLREIAERAQQHSER